MGNGGAAAINTNIGRREATVKIRSRLLARTICRSRREGGDLTGRGVNVSEAITVYTVPTDQRGRPNSLPMCLFLKAVGL